MVTRRDVARLAGTSPAVVSYVLNDGPRGVAPATRQRVLLAVEQLGYRPNRIAASLRTNRTMTLGLVVPDNTNLYFAELARQIEEVAFAAGQVLLLGNATDDPDRESAYVRAFLDRRVDGLLLIPSGAVVPTAAEITRSGTPWAVLDRVLDLADVPAQVAADNRSGGRLAAEHLLEHGRRRIACICGPREVRSSNERVMGWRDAMAAAGIDPYAIGVREGPLDRFAGYHAAADLLSRDGSVDAIFVASDEQAIGVLRALAEHGTRCPDDIALVSFDGVAASVLTTPALTTVRQPTRAMARAALRALDEQTSQGYRSGEPVVLGVDLVVRGSCGCPDAAGRTPEAPGGAVAG